MSPRVRDLAVADCNCDERAPCLAHYDALSSVEKVRAAYRAGVKATPGGVRAASGEDVQLRNRPRVGKTP